MATQMDIRQSVYRSALNMAGTSANATVDTILLANDPLIGQLYQDRNIILTDGGTITFTGTALQFTQNINLVINQAIGTTAVAVTVSLGSATQTLNNGDMWYAVLNRTLGTATTAIATAAAGLPAASNANQNIILIAKRFDSADGTQMVYLRNGSTLTAGQSARIGSSGSGSGSGTGDDLDALNFSVSFTDTFSDLSTSSLTSIDITSGHTNATYSPANKYYTLSYDASRTVTANTSTTMHLIGGTAPAYTVAVGDILRVGTQARKITVLGSINTDGGTGTPFQIEAAFTTNPSASACTVSQAVYTKDLNNFAVDGVAPSAIFTGAINTFILIYNDTTTGTIYNYTDPPLIAYTASADGTNFTSVSVREANPAVEALSNSTPTTGSNLYFRFFSDALTGSGTYNLVGYKTFFQSQNTIESGGVLNQAYAFTNGVGTPQNCTVSGSGAPTQVTLTWTYPMGLNSPLTNGSILVFLNGQKIPRFVNSTLTPDASYTELNGNTIQLDRDYSSQNLSIEVIQLAFVVDSNTQNTTNIAYINQSQFRNYLINGNFDIWQRATTNTIANGASTYVADRWYVKNSLGTSGVITFSQSTGVSTGARFGASVQITTAPTAAQANGTELYQVIENINTFDLFGQVLSAQAQIKALGLVNQVGIQFAYNTIESKPTLFFGTEQLVTVNTSTFTLGQLFAQAVSQSTITTSGIVGIRIRITGVSSGNLYALNNGFIVEQAMVNIGGTTAPFAKAGRNVGEELAMCQRYVEVINTNGAASGGALATGWVSTANTTATFTYPMKVVKRVNPVATVSSATHFNIIGGVTNAAATAFADAGCRIDSAYFTFTITGTYAVGSGLAANFNTAAARMFFEADI